MDSAGMGRMAMKFTLEIELGNDAMRSAYQLGERLKLVADQVSRRDLLAETVRISDLNGNTVGKWEVTE
jgi:hypothetical protein